MFFTRNGGEQTRDGSSAEERSHQNVKTSGVYSTYNMWNERKKAMGFQGITNSEFAEILLHQNFDAERDQTQQERVTRVWSSSTPRQRKFSFMGFLCYICQLRVCDIHCCALINSQGDREGNCYCSQLRLTKVIGLEIFQSHLYPLMPILQP